VIDSLNKGGSFAPNPQLAQIIKDNQPKAIYPYKVLPNVKDFQIVFKHPYDQTLLAEGIIKRVKSAEMESTPYKNKAMNRYVKFQFQRLNRLQSNAPAF
jgi:hypothetical protein